MDDVREAFNGIRVLKLEVDHVDGDWLATTQRWFALSRLCSQVANRFWRLWIALHTSNESDTKYQAWLTAQAADKTTAGKCPIDFLPPGLKERMSSQAYDAAGLQNIHSRCAGLLLQSMTNDYMTRKSEKCPKLKRWCAILLSRESIPCFKELLPIRFDVTNCKLRVDGTKIVLDLSAWRLPPTGANTRGTSVVDVIHIKDSTRKDKRHAELAKKLASGEWTYKGSILKWDDTVRKWFIHLCHEIPKMHSEVNSDRTAVLIPGRNVPFYIRERGPGHRSVWLQKSGKHITALRERLAVTRMERSQNHRLSRMRGGHGVKAALKWQSRSEKTWRYFVKRINHHVSHDAIRFCVANGIGRLVYLKPTDSVSQSRFVSGDLKTSGWQFFDLETLLKNKCAHAGIEFKPVACGEPAVSAKPKKGKKTVIVSQ